MKRNLLKSAFFTALCTVFALGVVMVSTPTDAAPGPGGNCPTLACPFNLSGWEVGNGWELDGECSVNLEHDCVELCKVYRNTSTGQLCKSNNCAAG